MDLMYQHRLPIALHIPSDCIPPSSPSSSSPQGTTAQPPSHRGTGAGYGPPPTSDSPLNNLIHSILSTNPPPPNDDNRNDNDASNSERDPESGRVTTAAGGGGGGVPSVPGRRGGAVNNNNVVGGSGSGSGTGGLGGGNGEYDLVFVPLTNGNWKDRWEKMCVYDPSPSSSSAAGAERKSKSSAGSAGSGSGSGSGAGRVGGGGGLEDKESQRSPRGSNFPQPGAIRVLLFGDPKDRSDLSAGNGGTGGGGARETLERERMERERDVLVEAERWRMGGAYSRGEVNVTSSDETRSMIGQASEWLELDSPVEGFRFDSELALKQEVAYASYLHVSTVVLPPPRHPEFCADYARAVNSALAVSSYITLSIRIPVSDASEFEKWRSSTSSSSSSSTAASSSKHRHNTTSSSNGSTATTTTGGVDPTEVGGESGTWEMWNAIRCFCGYSNRLTLALDLSTYLPSPSSLSRWISEPTRQIILPTSSFIPNAKGYPVLSKSCQAFLKGMLKFKPTIILSGVNRSIHPSGGPDAYVQYLRYLERRAPGEDPIEQYAGAYMDYLQAPLQPLMDNLESETYEGFERDPVKYRQYEEAVYQALCDRPPDSVSTIFVCGAGRGPLVAGCLSAAERASRKVKLTAVEKNQNAYVILQERKALEWGSAVDLVFSDMRSFAPSEKADIIVSELLGSFGDNELSPECLDGVMRWLKPNGISIPSSYTSYLAPICSAKLHYEVTGQTATEKSAEQPYVVMFQAASIISAKGGGRHSGIPHERVQRVWGFEHPRWDVVLGPDGLPLTNQHNSRSAHMTFHIPRAQVLHGFGGYFEAVLYKDVGIGIHPERFDGKMLSWFPIFFPIKDPLYLPAHSELDVRIFRLTDQSRKRIWFEWCAEAFLPISPSNIALAPSPPASANGFSINATAPVRSPLQGRGGGAWGGGPIIGSPMSEMSGSATAFGNAPSPLPSSFTDLLGNGSTAGDGSERRIKIGMTRMHNPAGRSSWIGL